MSVTDAHFPKHVIGHRIAQERERLGLSQAELAGKLSIGLQKMKAIEAGSMRPLNMQLMAYLAHCGFDINYVLIASQGREKE
ncbi:helix-turn-helix domain-containing protein [Pseudomonas migulae]|uniref:Helix-turn-helix domain-containing protein n=1 Tax=Pseudomonas migulae TaxID=78543 RepID=A0ABY8MLF3_9PSED|nr:helix-turn-helix domain-containing protein [Pseudomonas migulae]WGK88069.1 helix-turn-helix domain-containing protein [Pseudomonas migulae]